MATTREFSTDELDDLGLPFEAPEGGEIVCDEYVRDSRWGTVRECTFRLADSESDTAWRVTYARASGDSEGDTWNFAEKVKATLVRPVQVTVTKWEPVP